MNQNITKKEQQEFNFKNNKLLLCRYNKKQLIEVIVGEIQEIDGMWGEYRMWVTRILSILRDSRNNMPPILVLSSTKRIATQILVIAKLNRKEGFILRVFVCDTIRPSKEVPVQS